MPDDPSAWRKGVPLEFEPRCDCGCALPNERRESLQSMTPTPEQIALAKRVPYSSAAIAEAIAAAELRGHTRAVQEIVTWLRATARSDVALCGDMTAGSGAMLHAATMIERGEPRGKVAR